MSAKTDHDRDMAYLNTRIAYQTVLDAFAGMAYLKESKGIYDAYMKGGELYYEPTTPIKRIKLETGGLTYPELLKAFRDSDGNTKKG